MTGKELRKKYLAFFKERDHVIIPSASLIPENDPTVLFTGSGMQPMVPYLLGEQHPQGVRITDSQKCFRAQDIEEVGDNRHTTFFEMLGNWSLGDYFKKQQIPWMFEFLTKELQLDPQRIYITVFRGKEEIGIPRDDVSVKLWQEQFTNIGIAAEVVDYAETNGMQHGRIFYYDETKNWWSRAGIPSNMPIGEPGGPDSEMFWDFGAARKIHENSSYKDQLCHVNCDCGRFMEIGNNVFMEYRKTATGFEPLPQKNVDFGGGLERMTAAVLDEPDVFKTDLFTPIITKIKSLATTESELSQRIIADHLRAATFILGDPKGIAPSNLDQGYIVRRLVRRAVRHGKMVGITKSFTFEIAEVIIKEFSDDYPELHENKDFIIEQLVQEEEKFNDTLEKGLRQFEKIATQNITGHDAFVLFTTYGLPIEIVKDLAAEKDLTVDETAFEAELKQHQALSRTASAGKFRGGLADHSVATTKLHTATHLLLEALRRVLGDQVYQKGSNITQERLRLDYSYPDKMTTEQKQQIEDIVNEQIKKGLAVSWQEMSVDEAKEQNAMGVFEHKYAEKVKVYSIGDFSKEICGGPHVKNTAELGHFKIQKEEASSAGVRRIKAVLE